MKTKCKGLCVLRLMILILLMPCFIFALQEEINTDIQQLTHYAQKGDVKSQVQLGILLSSHMVCLDDSIALEWFKKAAAQKDPEAQFRIGLLHNSGRAIAQSIGEANVWFKRAAIQGHVNATCALDVRTFGISSQLVAESLKNRMSVLDLAGNDIGNNGLEILSEALPHGLSLNALHLKNNNISNVDSLSKVLPKLVCLKILDFWSNHIDRIGIQPLSASLPFAHVQILDLADNNLEDDGVKELCDHINETQIHTLHLGENNIGHIGAHHLAQALPGSCIHTLDLGKNKIGAQGIRALADVLNRTRLRIFDVAENNIGEEGVGYLSAGLIGNKLIDTLDLKRNNIGNRGAQLLARSMEGIPLKALNVRNNNIEASGIRELARVLPATMEILIISGNPIGDQGAECIAKILGNKPIEFLNMSGNSLSAQGAYFLLGSLSNKYIKTLHLGGNNLKDLSLDLPVTSWQNSTLSKLDLGGANLGEKGIENLSKILPDMRLGVLDLASNSIDQASLEILSRTLPPSLNTLNLSANKIDAKVIPTLIHTLRRLKELQTLNLAGNNMGDDGVKVLGEYLTDATVQVLNLSNNDIGDSGACNLSQLLPLTQVSSLDMEGNNIGNDGVIPLLENLENSNIRILNIMRNKFNNHEEVEMRIKSLDKSPVHTVYLKDRVIQINTLAKCLKVVKKNSNKKNKNALDSISVKLDFSVVASNDVTKETVETMIKRVAGIDSDIEVEPQIISETSYYNLPQHVIQRSGIRPDQKNLLLRLTFHSLERTLKKNDVQALADQIYRTIHQGAIINERN